MSNPNQHETQMKDLSVVIGQCSLDSYHGVYESIRRMLAVLISGTQIATKATIQLKVTNEENRLK